MNYRTIAETIFINELITKTYPTGLVSLVADSFDLFEVLTYSMPKLKPVIMARDGKVVIRPDSGNPVDIVCGELSIANFNDLSECEDFETMQRMAEDYILDDIREITPHGQCGASKHTLIFKYNDKYYDITIDNLFWNRYDKQFYYLDMYENPNVITKEVILHPANKGAIELLWDTFGGTINKKGYKVLDPHIGLIYGDSITIERAQEIFKRLEYKGFAASNIVFGVGSFAYCYNTRDSQSWAMKATWCQVNGEAREIFKEPKTDAGKKSAKGLMRVNADFSLTDQCSKTQEQTGMLQEVFLNGQLINETSLQEIRNKINQDINI